MNDNELKSIWQVSNENAEKYLHISREKAEEITMIKVHNFLFSMRPVKAIAVVIGILWVIFVDTLIISLWSVASPFFLVSAALQVILTKLAIGVYLYQLYLITKVDLSEPVLHGQERLSRLKSSTLWVTRILFLQLPVWTTFSLHTGMIRNGNIPLLILHAIISLSSAFIAVWLFLNIKYENRDKKWFRLLFNGREWEPIVKSMELIRQIEEYKSEDPKSMPAGY